MILTDKNLEDIAYMKQCGILDFSGGVGFIYRDPSGNLQAIKIELNTFRRGKVLLSPETLEWVDNLKIHIDINHN